MIEIALFLFAVLCVVPTLLVIMRLFVVSCWVVAQLIWAVIQFGWTFRVKIRWVWQDDMPTAIPREEASRSVVEQLLNAAPTEPTDPYPSFRHNRRMR
jgi:ABC-type glycerol-3-phosphate transport system permease component